MSRRRYLSSIISVDSRVNRVAMQHGDLIALIYTWMIPHAGDDGYLRGDPEELLAQVLPLRRDLHGGHMRQALAILSAPDVGLLEWDEDRRIVAFPAESFYRYQSYIKDGPRRGERNTEPGATAAKCAEVRDPAPIGATLRDSAASAAQNSAEQRKSAQNAASLKVSSSSSLKSSFKQGVAPPDPASPPGGDGDGAGTPIPLDPAIEPFPDDDTDPTSPEPTPLDAARGKSRPRTLNRIQAARFQRFYDAYPKHEHRPDAERAWQRLDPTEELTERIVADIAARRMGRKWVENFIVAPATYLNKRVWEDDIEPVRPAEGGAARASPNGRMTADDAVSEAIRRRRERRGESPPPGAIEATFRHSEGRDG